MDRRTFLSGTAATAATLTTAPAIRAEGYRRCDQIHERLTDEMIDRWVTPLPLPLELKTREIGKDGFAPNPPVGAVEQGTAPEYFWDPAHGEPPEPSQWGEQEPGRHRQIFRQVDKDGKPIPVHFAELSAEDVVVQAVPGWLTRRLTYRGETVHADGSSAGYSHGVPAPRIEGRLGEPLVVRLTNRIDPALGLDVSMHQHGGHIPAHSDGHPNFMVRPASKDGVHKAESRDYYYPNPVPLKVTGHLGTWKPTEADSPQSDNWDKAEAQTTMWYHDHAEDITAHNALMGLASFFFLRDKVEDDLRSEEKKILPPKDHEIPLVFQDVCLCPITDRSLIQPAVSDAIKDWEKKHPGRKLNGEARIHFDPFDHNGSLGNLILVNGVAAPVHDVNSEPYWLRMLNASLARFYNLELWAIHPTTREARRMRFLRFGKDSWMFDKPKEQNSVFLGMANRGDIHVDFADLNHADWKDFWRDENGEQVCEVFLVSTLNQKDGRGPGHGDNEQDVNGFPRGNADVFQDDRAAPMRLVKFRVKKAEPRITAKMTTDSHLRDHHSIHLPDPGQIKVREFNFERGRGAWQINHRFYDACISNAVPELWSTELWILRNRSGGWWHPIHIHVESHQQLFVQARNHRGERIVKKLPDYDPRKYEDFLTLGDPGIEEKGWLDAFPWEAEPGQEPTGFNRELWLHDASQRSFDDTVWNLHIKHDTTVLGPNTEVHILMRFRTFQGPFVFHCHNLNHEDMRMMFQMDPRAPELAIPEQEIRLPNEQLQVRKNFWFFHPLKDHHPPKEDCCHATKGAEA